jgi:cell division protein FtsB
MFDFHEKRKIRSTLYSKPVIGLLVVVSGFLIVSAYNRYEVAHETKHRLDVRQAELDALKEREASLEAKVRYLEDDRGVEEELRSRFDVAKEGEEVVIIMDDRSEVSSQEVSTPTPEPPSFLERLRFW